MMNMTRIFLFAILGFAPLAFAASSACEEGCCTGSGGSWDKDFQSCDGAGSSYYTCINSCEGMAGVSYSCCGSAAIIGAVLAGAALFRRQ